MNPLESKMREWLATGTPAQKAHAAARLARPFTPAAEPPPLRAQAKTLARAVGKWAAAGLPLADRTEIDRRLAICHACELYDAARGRCLKCGCLLAAKARLATERCPVGKW